ncbi:hypothetical protein EG328_002158 [Venturia inaequalis]|uniref:Heterokaryon incompatibility domain-containing protein n=1 Tax=Venturia inaequalis TaxID=5025 RepID=A0A8H3UXQ6_VENIN|nr:hypothetical protein EG328_002158 [Venturia inaequalis]KAE9977809.1 hypothetical protein EG327_007623 [Venturia inaequalis]RDI88804.1 hypothetical protein Vi05172_g1587 [Venturia inaequalis]
MSELPKCRHLDVRDFDRLRCCLSCGLAIVEANPTTNLKPLPESVYQHRPLNHSFGQEIRLVELLPGEFDDELRCNTIHTNLASQEEHDYQAISYTWATEHGSAELCQHVRCGPNRLFLPISENCANVLRRVRHRGLLRLIWIDMICIDQTNLGERNHQVALMSIIYSKASRVLIYLGQADDASDVVLASITGSRSNASSLGHVERFLSRRWFNRVWVIQEVAMAHSAFVLVGDQIVLWDKFSEGLLRDLKRVQLKGVPTIPPPLRVGTFFYRKDHDLMSLLIATQRCSSTDPRDKMYALLALASEKDPIPLSADYSRHNGWVCTQIAAWLTTHHQDLRVLRYANRGEHFARFSQSVLDEQEQMASGRLPTWVPYWPAATDTADVFRFNGPKHRWPLARPNFVTEDGHTFVHPSGPLNYVLDLGLRVVARRLGSVVTDTHMIQPEQTDSLDVSKFALCGREAPQSFSPAKGCCQRYQEIAEWNATDEEGQRHVNELFWTSLHKTTGRLFGNLTLTNSTYKIPSAFCSITLVGNSIASPDSRPSFPIKDSGAQMRCGICNKPIKVPGGSVTRHFDRVKLENFLGVVKVCQNHFDQGDSGNVEIIGFATEHSLGVGPRAMKNGDSVWRLGDEPQAYVLRMEEGRFKFVGPCFVYEALEDRDCCVSERGKRWETITIW